MENKAETKSWWRPTDSLYNFIMQCAKNDENGKRAIEVRGLLEDSDVAAGFSASSPDFEKGKLDSICFSIASYQGIRNIKKTVEEGIREFGGNETRMDVIFTCGTEWWRTIRTLCPVKLNLLGFPRIYTLRKVNLKTGEEEKLVDEAYGSSMFTPKMAAEMYADFMGSFRDEIIESKSRHGLFEIAFNGETGKSSIIIKREKSILSRVSHDKVNEIGDFIAGTGYLFRGKKWDIQRAYGE